MLVAMAIYTPNPPGNAVPDHDTIKEAAERIAPWVHRTPVITCRSIDRLLDAEVFFKCENLQKVGAFKARGASNAVFSLSDEQAGRGVATHSSGNHAQALAYAAANRGVRAHIVMPSTSPKVKVDAVLGYGADITFCEPNQKAREDALEKVVRKTGAVFIHPYDDYGIIAGQATAAMELIDEVPGLDIIMTPVGGGGLLSGTLLSAHYFSPDTKVIAGEPAGADDAFRSLKEGRILESVNPDTIADGLLTSLGEKTFPIIRDYVDSILLASDEFIIKSMRLIWERAKLVVEPSGAVPLAALLQNNIDIKGKKIGIILSGGNADMDSFSFC